VELDKGVAKLKLESPGIKIDRLTPEQEEYLASWNEGTWRRSQVSGPGAALAALLRTCVL